MSFFICLIDFVLMSVIAIDTLGLVNLLRKNIACDKNDYIRVCFTWIFFLLLSSMTTCSCTGKLAKLTSFLGLALRIFLSIPLLGGTHKAYQFLIVENKGVEYASKVAGFVKSATGMCAPQSASEGSTDAQ